MQLDQAEEGARTSTGFGPITIVLIALSLSAYLPLWRVIVWPAVVICVTAGCGLYYGKFVARDDPSIASVARRARFFAMFSLLQIIVWCGMGIMFWMPGHETNNLMVGLGLCVALAAWTVIGSFHFATGVSAMPVFLVILTLNSLVREQFMMTGIVTAYWLLMVSLFSANYTTREKMIRLELERGDLIAGLRQAKSVSDSARDKAETASRAKSAFLANMSHELRTPLNAILGFSEIINIKALGTGAIDQYADYAGHIHSSGKHLLTVISDILELAKIDAGKLVLREAKVDIKRVIEDAVQAMSGRAEIAQLTIGVEADDDLPYVFADERAMRQVFANLLSNAIKFTQPGGEIRAFAQLREDGTLTFGVSDTGVGIAPEEQTRVFDGYGQGRADTAIANKGTGLGLPIVKGLIDAHGGHVVLDSAPGKGTTVIVIFPRSRLRDRLRAAG
jgi:two-component system cell cycle sensor histidine kinase PleC